MSDYRDEDQAAHVADELRSVTCMVCGKPMQVDDCMDCDGEGIALLYPEQPMDEDDCDYGDCPTCGGSGRVFLCCKAAESEE